MKTWKISAGCHAGCDDTHYGNPDIFPLRAWAVAVLVRGDYRFLFIWSGFLSVSYCSKKCLSIKIEQFVAAFPRRGKALFKVVNHTFELIFFLYMIPFAYSYMMSAIHSGQLSPACGIPMYYIQAAPFVSFLLVTFRILQRWIIEFKVARGEDVYDPAHPERNTPESFIHANADMPEKESNEIKSLIEANTPSGKEEH